MRQIVRAYCSLGGRFVPQREKHTASGSDRVAVLPWGDDHPVNPCIEVAHLTREGLVGIFWRQVGGADFGLWLTVDELKQVMDLVLDQVDGKRRALDEEANLEQMAEDP